MIPNEAKIVSRLDLWLETELVLIEGREKKWKVTILASDHS